ncbi:hypothetical protein NBM05_08490 [Rothia sp. AR01]|uniref:NlpC/P60 domain-containing protein n=1 Tax=Rothia santali TaxID=2949643 RepID=A0A9X2KIP3_9MICC|nr:peptidoglycan amidohydrolase family protein [Rothia santali]MCP3426039.1 hypothetical protein [Rothia santali]
MSEATERMIEWFAARAGRVRYSMSYRTGPGAYDCSSAVYFAMIHAGLRPPGSWIGNTESLFRDLPAAGWHQLPADPGGGFIDALRGDVFIWGRQGASSGAAGHTGIFVDAENIIHCNAGYDGITINDHDAMWAANLRPPVVVYRHGASVPTSPAERPVSTREPLEEIMSWYRNRQEFEDRMYEKAKDAVINNVRWATWPGFNGQLQNLQTVLNWGLTTIMNRVDPKREIRQYGMWKGQDLGANKTNVTTHDREAAYRASEDDKRRLAEEQSDRRLSALENGQREILALLKEGK